MNRTRNSPVGRALRAAIAANAVFWAGAVIYDLAVGGAYDGGANACGWSCMCVFNALPGIAAALPAVGAGGGPTRSAMVGAAGGLASAGVITAVLLGLGGPVREGAGRDLDGLWMIGTVLAVKEGVSGAWVGLLVGRWSRPRPTAETA